jgi:hypothetical protein
MGCRDGVGDVLDVGYGATVAHVLSDFLRLSFVEEGCGGV